MAAWVRLSVHASVQRIAYGQGKAQIYPNIPSPALDSNETKIQNNETKQNDGKRKD